MNFTHLSRLIRGCIYSIYNILSSILPRSSRILILFFQRMKRLLTSSMAYSSFHVWKTFVFLQLVLFQQNRKSCSFLNPYEVAGMLWTRCPMSPGTHFATLNERRGSCLSHGNYCIIRLALFFLHVLLN